MNEKIACLIMETYSVKMVIANACQGSFFVMCDSEFGEINLGLEDGSDYFLKKPQIDLTISVLKNFRKLCDMHGVTRSYAVANFECGAKPKNIYSFFDEVYATCGFKFTILSDEEQQNYVFSGLSNGYDIHKGVILHVNSESINIIQFNRRNILNQTTLPFGPMTLANMFGDIKDKDTMLQKIEKYIKVQFDDVEWLAPLGEEMTLTCSGRAFTDISKMVRKYKKYPLKKDDGYELNFQDSDTILKQLSELSLDKTKRIRGIEEPRSDVFVAGLVLANCIAEKFNTMKCTIVENAMRSGIFYREVIPATLEKPVADVLGYSLLAQNNFYDLEDSKHNEQVYNLSILLFKQLRVLHKLPRGYVKVLRIASYMHDAGKRINCENHADFAYPVIIGSDIKGATHREIVLAGFAASLHQGGELQATEWVKYKDLLLDEDIDAVRKLGVILRLAEAFDRTKRNCIVDINCDILGDSVIMKTVSEGDNSFEIQKALECSKDFEKYYRKKLEIL